VSLNGEPVKDITSFRNRVAMITPDTAVKLEVVREGQPQSFSLNIGKLPDTVAMAGDRKQSSDSAWGLSVQTLNEQLANQLGVDGTQGVVVTGVDPTSVAAAAGIQPGMVITEVNRKAVSSAKEFEEAVKVNKDTNSLLLLVQSGGRTQYLALQKEKSE
jgi:serine protease Do